ncbi:hypothetical protein QA635_15025 [Bradyrhizobium brasilense]|uniref:hypothetical protein n=1 Tax=Bradyrhizobium brasilense TaxID=1419277 RepID=UPI0024B0A513|nr:hypothetical protein [Bradyrhizobium australafricanum]WFU35640.1 hypothetical protein QA635_15025 [Bradyrhizobium australafricanum]
MATTLLLSGFVATPAFAADYSVDVGVETKAGKDAGSLGCVYEETCGLNMPSLGLRVTLLSLRTDPSRVTIYVSRHDLSCCYFESAADSLHVDRRKSTFRVPIFTGARAKGGLFIQNERVGTLYLRFDTR